MTTLARVALIAGARTPTGATPPEVSVSGFGLDSRTLAPGHVFAAIKGVRHDGHAFVRSALERGAAGAIVERVPDPAPGHLDRLLLVPSVPVALQALARDHRAGLGVTVVAVTGSSGKTTTKEVIASVLGAHLPVATSAGNLNSQLGLPITILNGLTAAHRVGVYEVGMSARGEIARLCAVLTPERGVITNVGPAHLEFLGSVEEVFLAKSELAEALPRTGRLYLNGEDAYHERQARLFAGPTVLVSLEDPEADLFAHDLHLDLDGLEGAIDLRARRTTVRFRMPIPGSHMAYAALFALAVATDLGMSPADAAGALASCRPVAHRMEPRTFGAIRVLDDSYNANPASTRATIDFVCALPRAGRRIVVLGDMLELGDHGADAHRQILDRVLASPIERAVFVGPLYIEGGRDHPAVAAALAAGRVVLVSDRAAALEVISGTLRDGDLLVLKGSRGIGLEGLLDGLFG